MDFASLMSKELSKASSSVPSDKKYISRREAEEQRRKAYLEEQKRLEEERAAKAAEKRRREEEAAAEARAREEKRRKLAEEQRARKAAKEAEEERARRRRLGLPEVPPTAENEEKEKEKKKQEEEAWDEDDEWGLGEDARRDIPDDELTTKLRSLGEPALLFGEDHSARLRRYRTALRRERGLALPTGPIETSLPPVEEKDMKVPPKAPPASDRKARRFLFRQLASYFNMVLREWEAALAREDNADTFAGQAARKACSSSKETMRPLFRKFETGDLDEEILSAIVEIVHAAQERRYVDANDGYLRLSIGKAAWPIGVTMVGIHERSAREKLHDGERGHIMGSEITRKYLQSIKRCLTFAQVRWPPEDVRQLMG
ncbi:putative pre-mRNA splicing factor [Thermochaetoides thermophila DSM 1495]|uniref:Pre-mRNA-splicing factor 18 n=1 Tax=Chaetomium thermophilum (strain DSM 1495 / CBS 144.50 / IMI 039719) TaxID=759272 RepID=G0S5D0_CHATD|nr:putative pre-mRNA splicing factor [Thermochaetoides thermophila DSM 1495]EGS20603.1 putative pre-mRNA splicing factor [Thermochaetoides thermophila DSM 1495]